MTLAPAPDPSSDTSAPTGAHPWRAVGRHWVASIVTAAASLVTVGDIGEHVWHRPAGTLDLDARAWALAHMMPGALLAFAWISRLGAPAFAITFAVLVAVWLWRAGARHAARVLAAAPAIAVVLFNAVKYTVRRVRPVGALSQHVLTFSFPSGHSAVSATVFCTLGWVLAREGKLPSAFAVLLAVLCPLLIGLSRVYLDVHWMTDVFAGWALGVAVAALAIGVYEAGRHRRVRAS